MSYGRIQTAGIIILLVYLFLRVFVLSGIENTALNNLVNYSFLASMVVVFVLLFFYHNRR